MTPSADSADAARADAIVPAELLDDGEIVLLAIKPSVWFVVLVSWPVLVVAGLTAVAAQVFYAATAGPAVLLICAAAACLRVVLACLQWMGVLYVLTNRRVMRIRGLLRPDVASCLLNRIDQVPMTASVLEQPLGLGSLGFIAAGHGEAGWAHIANPTSVRQTVLEAVSQAK